MDFSKIWANLMRILQKFTPRFALKNAINYHFLLACSLLVILSFYNGEIWLRVGEFIESSNESPLLKTAHIFCHIFATLANCRASLC